MTSLARYCAAVGLAIGAWLPAVACAETLTVSVTDASGRPLENAVVAVMVRGTRERAAPDTVAEMAQRDRSFIPSVLVIQTGTAVSFPNLDTVRHHVYSFSPIRTFEIKLYVGTPANPILFDKPGTAVLGCNIHDRMAAFVHVVDTPYFARTSASGSVSIEVPPGEHGLRTWHPMLQTGAPLESRVRVNPGSGASASVRMSGG